MLIKKWLKLSLLCLLFVGIQSVYAAVDLDKIIIFGDSLSDNGNIYSITSKAHKVIPPIPIIPKNPPYYEGRFSNGPVWVELLAKNLNIPLVDYAYGGSWVESLRDSHQVIPFGLGMQVNFYLVGNVLDRHREKHLYVIWAGANDYIQGREDADYATTNTVETIEDQIDWLAYYGGKHFLILGVPDLGRVPEAIQKGAGFVDRVRELSTLHNKKLFAMVQAMQKKYPNVTFQTVDINGYFEDLFANPDKYNLKNVTDACYGGGYYFNLKLARMTDANELRAAKEQANIDIMNSPSLRVAYLNSKLAEAGEQPCPNQDEYLFWDQLHPTRVLHSLIATFASLALNAT